MLDRIKHIFGRHKYIYIRRLSDHAHLLGCAYCNKIFCIHTKVKTLLEWDMELADLYYTLNKKQWRNGH
jgi:Fe2+ or Zn2+ uptake regulation protein